VWREMDFALMHANACDVLTSVTWGA
jgi:hypothetical protein